jgi:hypothetical protein
LSPNPSGVAGPFQTTVTAQIQHMKEVSANITAPDRLRIWYSVAVYPQKLVFLGGVWQWLDQDLTFDPYYRYLNDYYLSAAPNAEAGWGNPAFSAAGQNGWEPIWYTNDFFMIRNHISFKFSVDKNTQYRFRVRISTTNNLDGTYGVNNPYAKVKARSYLKYANCDVEMVLR